MPKSLNDLSYAQAKMFLFKGAFGTGKSPAAASFPGPIYFADFDRRMSAVKKMFPHRKDIYYDTFTTYPKFIDAFNEILERPTTYKTVVIPDSLTNYVELVVDYFISIRGGGKLSDAGQRKEKGKGIVALLGIDDYSAETRALSELLVNLKYIVEQGVNVISTAHIITTQTTNIKTGSQTIEKFLLTYGKKGAAKIPTLFDEIYHFYTDSGIDADAKPKYIVRTQNDGEEFARSSFWMPEKIDWTDKNFYETIKPYFNMIKDSPMDTSLAANVTINKDGEISINDTSLGIAGEVGEQGEAF